MGRGRRPTAAGDCQPEPGLEARGSSFPPPPGASSVPTKAPSIDMVAWVGGEQLGVYPGHEECHQKEGQVVAGRSVAAEPSGASLEAGQDQKGKSQCVGKSGAGVKDIWVLVPRGETERGWKWDCGRAGWWEGMCRV